AGANNKIDVNPLLQPLANNGGTTQTLGLLPGSPAVNAGSNPAGLAFDQRGAGFPRLLGAGVDIGAFEGVLPVPVGMLNPLAVALPGATPNMVSVTYTDDVAINV